MKTAQVSIFSPMTQITFLGQKAVFHRLGAVSDDREAGVWGTVGLFSRVGQALEEASGAPNYDTLLFLCVHRHCEKSGEKCGLMHPEEKAEMRGAPLLWTPVSLKYSFLLPIASKEQRPDSETVILAPAGRRIYSQPTQTTPVCSVQHQALKIILT